MLGRTTGAVLVGVEACLVEVEVHLGGGLPNIAAVGLANSSVREGIDRIRAALTHSGFKLPQHRVTVNLAPADIRKQGACLDLPIAAAILAADGRLGGAPARDVVLAGELALDGAVRPVRGVLAIALAARAAGRRGVLVPAGNVEEALLVPGIRSGVRRLLPTRSPFSRIRRGPARHPRSERRMRRSPLIRAARISPTSAVSTPPVGPSRLRREAAITSC